VGKAFLTVRLAPAILLVEICFPLIANAGDREQLRITAIQHKVNLVASDQATRAASINDPIVDGNSVATGADSRAEIALGNGALVRLSSNAVFNFKHENLEIEKGAMLVQVPRGTKMRADASGIAADISDATAVLENQGALFKFLVIQGCGRLHRGDMGDSVLVAAGQMVFGNVKSAPSDPVDFEIARFVKTCPLIQGFARLPSDNSIVEATNDQLRLKSEKRLIETNLVIFGGGSTVSLVDPHNSTHKSGDPLPGKSSAVAEVRQ
jgi:hypothetical protein